MKTYSKSDLLQSDLHEKSISLKSPSGKRKYKPKEGSGAYALLMGLFKFKIDEDRTYGLQREIKEKIAKINEEDFPCVYKGWSSKSTLLKY